MSFEARYHGKCQSCLEQIEPGDEVEYDEDDDLVHTSCARPAPVRFGNRSVAVRAQRTVAARVCATCHTEMPLVGGCENC